MKKQSQSWEKYINSNSDIWDIASENAQEYGSFPISKITRFSTGEGTADSNTQFCSKIIKIIEDVKNSMGLEEFEMSLEEREKANNLVKEKIDTIWPDVAFVRKDKWVLAANSQYLMDAFELWSRDWSYFTLVDPFIAPEIDYLQYDGYSDVNRLCNDIILGKVSNESDWERESKMNLRNFKKNSAKYKGKDVELNKPMRGDVKKFKVFVENDKGNVVKVNFGDKNMEIKRDDPERKKNFRARHNCDNPGPKTKARYWSCKMWSDKPVSDIVSNNIRDLKKESKNNNKKKKKRCWEGYEPVPNKKPYSENSCRKKSSINLRKLKLAFQLTERERVEFEKKVMPYVERALIDKGISSPRERSEIATRLIELADDSLKYKITGKNFNLSDVEMQEVARWIVANTYERYVTEEYGEDPRKNNWKDQYIRRDKPNKEKSDDDWMNQYIR